MKQNKGFIGLVLVIIVALGILGWVKDVVKLVKCDFKAPYKAEVIYGLGAITGAGSIIGWVNIND